jgi:NitT/TauT family transport system ATP-binding protein
MVFQSAALMPWRTVMSNVTYGLELQGNPTETSKQAAERLIELVGLRGFEESLPRELSGGMQQRVNLARALATSPDLLLMDEPLAGLDAQTRELMQVELQRVWLETHKTTLYVTHLIDEAIFLADEVIVMTARPGRVKLTLAIDLPRPRSLEIKQTPAFHSIQARLWGLIKEELRELVDGGLEAPA